MISIIVSVLVYYRQLVKLYAKQYVSKYKYLNTFLSTGVHKSDKFNEDRPDLSH